MNMRLENQKKLKIKWFFNIHILVPFVPFVL